MKTRHAETLRPSSTRPRPSPAKKQRARKASLKRPLALAPRLRQIMVTTDFSKPSLKALNYAVSFAEKSGATIQLVYIIDRPAYQHDLDFFPLAVEDPELVRRAEEKLYTLASAEIEELVPIKVQVRLGKPFREIVELARESNTDLIIICTRGHTGLSRKLLGSTAELVVRHASCPVLVVREREHEFV